MMFLPILVCLLITASLLGYAVYRAYKLAELERIARSWDGMRLGRLAGSIDLEKPLLPVDDDPLGLRHIDRNRSATFPQFDVPPDAHTVVHQIGKTEPIGWFDSAGNWYKVPEPQPDYEEIQAVYPDWKPGK